MDYLQSNSVSQGVNPDWTSISIEKYSYATSPEGARTHRWNHDTRKDVLAFTLKTEQFTIGPSQFEKRLILTVTAGSTVLENLDVQRIAGLFQQYEEQQRMNPATRIEPAVQVMIKSPSIAIRYPESPAAIRRFQIKFETEQRYHQALHILRYLKFPFKEPTAKNESSTQITSSQRGSITSLPILQPTGSIWSSSTPSVIESSNGYLPHSVARISRPFSSADWHPPRPDTKSPSSINTLGVFPDGNTAKRPHSTLSVSSERLPWKDGHFQMPARPSSSNDTLKSFDTSFMQMRENEEQLPYPTDNIPKAGLEAFQTSIALSHPQEAVLPSYHDKNAAISNNSGSSTPRRTGLSEPMVFSDSGKITCSVTTTQEFSQYQAHNSLDISEVAQIKRSATASQDFTQLQAHNLAERQNLPFGEPPRPMSVPLRTESFQSTNWLPPKRILPFAKPRETPRPVPKKETPVPPPKPKTATKRPVEKHASPEAAHQINRENEATREGLVMKDVQHDFYPREEEPSPLASKSASTIRPSTAPGISKGASTRKRPGDVLENPASAKAAKLMKDASTQTQTLSGRDHTIAICRVPTNEQVAPTTPATPRPPSPPADVAESIEAFILKYKHRPAPLELWERPGWETATEEQRQAMVDDFICENLQDENFLKLCETVENVWTRIGLERM